jgi:hypothetical protein
VPVAAVAGFFDDLLPRLQVLQYIGLWPQDLQSKDAASLSTPLPLPHLRTLKLKGFGSHAPPWTWFMGARPLDLCTDDTMIERWLPPEDGDGDAAAAANRAVFCPLASVRTLQVSVRAPILLTPTNVARLLRAAPHLEMLIVYAYGVDVDDFWLSNPAFCDLVHLRLRHIRVSGLSFTTLRTSDCIRRLRQRHFPRLKGVASDGCEYFVTPLESPSLAKRLFNRFVKFAVALVSS